MGVGRGSELSILRKKFDVFAVGVLGILYIGRPSNLVMLTVTVNSFNTQKKPCEASFIIHVYL